MAKNTIKKDTSSVGAGGRSKTGKEPKKDGPVRVWSECSVTVAISEDPPQFVKFTHGFERMAPNSKRTTITQVEDEIYRACEKIVEKRIKRLTRVIRQFEADA